MIDDVIVVKFKFFEFVVFDFNLVIIVFSEGVKVYV